jgi:hypothetical protein
MIGRRDFITLLGSTTAAWPLAAGAQQARMRRIGVLLPYAADDQEGQARLAAFQQALAQLGWSDGGNVRIDTRWGAGDPDRYRKYAAELVALGPDVVLGVTTAVAAALQRETRSVPIVFAGAVDPVGAGVVASLARPGGNATGFTLFEYGMSGKWLELLKQIAPAVTRVGVVRDPLIVSGIGQFAAIQGAAGLFGIEAFTIGVRDVGEIRDRDPAVIITSIIGPDWGNGLRNLTRADWSERLWDVFAWVNPRTAYFIGCRVPPGSACSQSCRGRCIQLQRSDVGGEAIQGLRPGIGSIRRECTDHLIVFNAEVDKQHSE